MKIRLSGKDLPKITIRDLVNGYMDDGENGVVGYGGKLNIRPAFQREFVYGGKERDAVIKTVRQGFPLNTMYWSEDEDGNYELMDGQQRTVSICQYVTKIIPIKFDDGNELAFTSLPKDQQEQILEYELSVYVCEGTPSEKLAWFRTINIAGKPLTEQELLNAQHTGTWLTDAKRWFSKTGAPAIQDGRDKLVAGSPIRQQVLETALRWISDDHIERYMNEHKDDTDAQELWQYWLAVFNWVQKIFPNQDSARTRLMEGLQWGEFYNKYKNEKLNPAELEERIVQLIDDDDVNNKKGIYEYLLTGNERTLSLRAFDEKTKIKKFTEQKGICPVCNEHFEIDEMEADHIIPWSKGGKTTPENCQMLCRMDNRTKSGR
ncbi:MAG TPA: DUF262 domain-containing protein [Candidatus Paceibacterota bacterium]|nr:DUF262 domain-containing protein [Candidatus Paceibacterota bacterium]